jgi:hypothetical protein
MHKLRYGRTLTSVSFVSDEMELGMYACYLKKRRRERDTKGE